MSRATSTRLQRRMAMSRRMLQRQLPVRPDAAAVLGRPLTDDEQTDVLLHDVHQALHGDAALRTRALHDLNQRISQAQQELVVKRLELQAAWQRLDLLETEKRHILAGE